jgi:ElaB/YqjD/DUF883 family membrane-anchored ribosome-binding protein
MSDTTYTPPKSNLAGQAKNMARDVRDKAANLTGDVKRAAKDQASQLSDAAKEFATSATGQVQDKVQQAVSQQKSAGADYIGSIAQAAQRAAGEFDDAMPQAAHYIRQASEQIQGVADTVRERDMRDLVGEVENFARQQPTLFFGGAVILGFAALRFLKSSAPAQQSGPNQTSYSGYGAFEQRRSNSGASDGAF